MVSPIRTRISLAVAIVGVLIVIGGLALPLYKTPQEAIATGPTIPYGNLNSTYSQYLIPEVDKGSVVTIVVTGYSTKSIDFFLFPTSGDLSPSGPTLFSYTAVTSSILRISFQSPQTTAYGISVDSTNKTQFALAVSGTWSPYYYLRAYLSEGATLTLAGVLAYTYFRFWEARKRLEEKATADLHPQKA